MIHTGGVLLTFLLVASSSNVTVVPGVLVGVPQGYVISNLDPWLNSTDNGAIYTPNFVPGFQAGLTNTSIYWNSGNGFADLGYSVGPWPAEEADVLPHFSVGPQCCNFHEVPHTQQFTRPEWGDHYYSMSGFGSPGVNVQNYTAVWGDPPSYVGLRTDWNWKVQISVDWTMPSLMDSSNEWAAIGVAASQYVQGAPGDLVYTIINFWMDSNSSKEVSPLAGSVTRGVTSPGTVVYHPIQIPREGNQTITVNVSPYLADTVRLLGLSGATHKPPVIPYVYLNVEGYNFRWNSTLWSFKLMTGSSSSTVPLILVAELSAVGLVATAVLSVVFFKRGSSKMRTEGSPLA